MNVREGNFDDEVRVTSGLGFWPGHQQNPKEANMRIKEKISKRKVWKAFKIKTMGEYHDLYLGSDVLLLPDVFESFRKTCLQQYSLNPCHYFTSPGLP